MSDPKVEAVLEAARDGLTVLIEYRDAEGDLTRRRVDVQWSDGVYFSGYCHLRSDDRNFRIDRVRTIEVVGSHARGPTQEPEIINPWQANREEQRESRTASAGSGCCIPLALLTLGGIAGVILCVRVLSVVV